MMKLQQVKNLENVMVNLVHPTGIVMLIELRNALLNRCWSRIIVFIRDSLTREINVLMASNAHQHARTMAITIFNNQP